MGQMMNIPTEDYFKLVGEASCWRVVLSVARSGKSLSPELVLLLEESNKEDMKQEVNKHE